MTDRATVKKLIRNFLGTAIDDPLFGDSPAGSGLSPLLDPIVQQVVDGLVEEIHRTNRQFLVKSAVLAADSSSSNLYTLGTQSTPITDFAHWIEVRYTNENGAAFEEERLDALLDAGAGFFALTGPDESLVLQTSPDTTAGIPIWLRWGYWPALLAADSSPILGVPERFHDVVELDALFVFGVGGESRWPQELRERWTNRRAALFAHVSQRGVTPARTRLDRGAGAYLG